MAATNFTPIQLYFSTTASAVPLAANLAQGELAINITDGKLYYEDNAGAVQVIATKGAGTIGGSTTQIQYNNAGALAGNAAMVFNNSTNVTTLTTLNLTNALGAIYGGTAQSTYTQGDFLYASASNTLAKLGIGANTYILTSTGSVPQWVAPSSIAVLTATNLAGGLAGSVPYQSALDTTTFLAIGAANRVMTSTGTAPQWVTSLTGLTGVSSSSITNTSLTSGRVVVSTTAGLQADDADLTFDGTTLSAGGFSTVGLSTLVKTVKIGDSSFNGVAVFAAATPAKLYMGTGTVTDVTSAISATNAIGAIASLGITPIAATNTSVTYTNAATLYIAGAPSAGTNVTLTNPYALYVAAGDAYFGGTVTAGTVNLTTLDLTNLEVTNIKAKDGTAAMTIADSTGVVSFTANPILSGGTANGVLYLNGSKVATSGSALYFDGTNLGIGTALPTTKLDVSASSDVGISMTNSSSVTSGNRGTFSMNNSAGSTVGYVRFLAVTDNSGTNIQFGTRPAAGSVANSMLLGSGSSIYNQAILTVTATATATRQNLAAIDRTTTNWVRFTNPQFSADASMGLILKSFPDSDSRQGAGVIASGGLSNNETDLSLFITNSSSVSYAAYTAASSGVNTTHTWNNGAGSTAMTLDNVGLGIGATATGKFLAYQAGQIQNYQGAYGSSGTFQTGTGSVTLGGGANARGIGVLINANRAVSTTLTYGNNYETFGLIAVANVGTGGGYGTTGVAGYAESDGGVYGLRADAKTTSVGGTAIAVGLYVGSVTGSSTNYGVYVADTAASNYFGGNFLIGTTSSTTTADGGFTLVDSKTHIYGNSSANSNSTAFSAQKTTFWIENNCASTNSEYAKSALLISSYEGAGSNPGPMARFYRQQYPSAPARVFEVNFLGNIGLGDTNASTSGTGITFPATQSASSNANTLDDYEEGYWTPTDASGASLSLTATGLYTKIGDTVYAWAQVTYPVTASSSGASIGGLPFPILNNGTIRGGGTVGYTNTADVSNMLGVVNDSRVALYTNVGVQTTNVQMSAKDILYLYVYQRT